MIQLHLDDHEHRISTNLLATSERQPVYVSVDIHDSEKADATTAIIFLPLSIAKELHGQLGKLLGS